MKEFLCIFVQQSVNTQNALFCADKILFNVRCLFFCEQKVPLIFTGQAQMQDGGN